MNVVKSICLGQTSCSLTSSVDTFEGANKCDSPYLKIQVVCSAYNINTSPVVDIATHHVVALLSDPDSTEFPSESPSMEPSVSPSLALSAVPSAAPTYLTTTFTSFITASAQTVSGVLTSSLDNILITSGQMAGGAMGPTGSGTFTAPACRLSSDAISTTTRNWIFYSVDQGYTKMVQVRFVLVNSQLQLTGISSGYRTTDFTSSCTNVNTAWTSRTNNGAGGIATCQSCSGYGIKNI
eukprot:gene30933-38232_t